MISQFAKFISFVFNPLFILIFLPYVLVYQSTGDQASSFWWTGYTFIFLLAIAIFIYRGIRKKIFTDWDVSRRDQRPYLFSFFLILGLVYLLGLLIFQAPRILFVVIIGMLAGVITVNLINKKIKASMHVATLTALVSGIVLRFGGYYLMLLFLIPLVGWSRIKVKRHSVSEVVMGAVIGGLLLFAIYTFYQGVTK